MKEATESGTLPSSAKTHPFLVSALRFVPGDQPGVDPLGTTVYEQHSLSERLLEFGMHILNVSLRSCACTQPFILS